MASPWEESTATEASPANIWAAEDAKGGAMSGMGTPLFFFPCRREENVDDDVSLQIQRRRRPQPERRRHSEKDAHCQAVSGAVSPERFFSSTAGMAHEGVTSQRPLHRQHLHSRGEMPRYGHVLGTGGGGHDVVVHRRPNSRQQQWGRPGQGMYGPGDGACNKWSGGQSYGVGMGGCGEMAGGEVVTASPKSPVSSAESWGGGGPATVWELDSTGEGDGGLPEQRKRKRSTGIAAEIDIGLQQLQMIRLRESSPGLGDNVQSIDELKKFLLCDSMELESSGISTKEEIRKKEENITQLLQLLKMASLERDEARELLQDLLNKIAQCSPVEHPSYIHPADPSVELTRCDSGVTEFDSQSLCDSHQLYSYSPVQPLSDLVSSTELPNVRSIPASSNTVMSQQPLLPGYTSSMTMELPLGTAKFDHASAMLDALVVKKPLPEKGKLLQAVMEAGPLLQTLLVAGPLPQWRNPPPLKPFQMPPVSVNACESGTLNNNAVLNPNYLVQSSAKVLHYQNSLVASCIYAASSMKPSTLSTLCTRVPMLSTCATSYKVPIVKGQKI